MLHKIVGLTCRQSCTDLTKLSRWIRCLFHLSINQNEAVSLKCIEHVTQLASMKHGVSCSVGFRSESAIKPNQDLWRTKSMMHTPPPSPSPIVPRSNAHPADDICDKAEKYPETELEWLATSTYNRAVDYYIQEDDDNAKLWAQKSFMIAQWLEDNGALRGLLMGKFSTLQFDDA